jgi:hypothetical protein
MLAWAVPGRVFSGMVVVSLLTCLLAPILIRVLLRREADEVPGDPSRDATS